MADFKVILLCCVCFMFIEVTVSQSPVHLSYHIIEGLSSGSLIGNIAEDAHLHTKYDATVFQRLRYTFLNTNNRDNDFFTLNEYGGIISTARVIDRDSLDQCQGVELCYLHIQVAVSPAEYFQVIRISVEIEDLNDNQPRFPTPSVTIEIPETVLINTTFLTPAAIDPDAGSNGIQSYNIDPPSDMFGYKLVTSIDGSVDIGIIVKKKLDREKQDFYQLKLMAKDGGVPPLTGWTTVDIKVTDINDHTPRFENVSYSVDVEENFAVNSTIIVVKAVDEDIGPNGDLVYIINKRAPKSVKSRFAINNKTGEVITLQDLNFEEGSIYHIPILVKDRGIPPKMAATLVTVNVIDLNDNYPEIIVNTLSSAQQISVSENAPNGTVVVPVSISDKDNGVNGNVTCRLSSPKFALKHMYDRQYKIILNEQLDYEKVRQHNLTIWCEDNGSPKLSSMRRIVILVRDENDHAPEFMESLYVMTIVENNDIGSPIGEVKATDLDAGTNGQVLYSLSLHSDADYFYIDRYTGLISARFEFDRELKDEFILYVIAVDNSQKAMTNTATVVVSVLDQNDEPPAFTLNDYPFIIAENQSKLTPVGQVNATDQDLGRNGEVWFQIDPKATKELELFSIRPDSGEIFTKQVLDREVQGLYRFAVIASDKGAPMQTSSAFVTVTLTDVNDEIPQIEFPRPDNDTISVSFLTPVGIAVTQVIAHDDDEGDNGRLTYFIHSGNKDHLFAIDPSTGEVMVKRVMTTDDIHTYLITIGMRDNGTPSQYTTYVTVTFEITNQPYVAESDGTPNEGPHQNLIIVICLSSVSAVLVIILIVAIVWMKRQNRESVRYNCRIEANKKFNQKTPPPPPPPSKQRNHQSDGSEEEGDSSISTISRGDVHMEKMNGHVVTTFPARTESEAYKMSYMQSNAAPGLTVLPPGDRSYSSTKGHQHHDIQVNNLLGLLKKEHRDSDSACSVEISNPDSGKGSSELDIHSRSSRQSPSQGMYGDRRDSRRSRSTPLLNQQQARAVQQSRQSHHTVRYDGHQHPQSAASRQCTTMALSPQPHPQPHPQHRRYSSSSTSSAQRYRHSSEQSGVHYQERHSDYYPPSTNGYSVQQNGGQNYAPYNRNSCRYNYINRRRRKEPTGTMVHDESINEISDDSEAGNYACADVDRVLSEHEEDSIDDNSTTSGEYTVDADGLVQEIDNLFFQDMIV